MLVGCASSHVSVAQTPRISQVDERRAAQVGIRKIVSRHLRLYTDLPSSNAVDELPAVFDAAVNQWADYFGIPQQRVSRWKMQGFLMKDKAKFAALRLLPETKTDFENGYAQGYELWLNEQPSDYYRRHLLLHEGTHGFMHTQLGHVGPGWYAEGTAELLGTHRWKDGKLKLNTMPASREEVPMWGRIKLIRDASRAGEALGLSAVLGLSSQRVLSTDQYAWCWGLCRFLDSHPQWQSKFRQLPKHVRDPKFNQHFLEAFSNSAVSQEWVAFVAALDYGYAASQMAIVHSNPDKKPENGSVEIATDRGWQATGWQLKAGKQYEVTASGRFQIAQDSQPWPCEPGGVTLRYHEGQPLGILLGAISSAQDNSFANPVAIGLQQTLKPDHDGELYLRVNDSPAKLSDNKGSLQVTISSKPSGK